MIIMNKFKTFFLCLFILLGFGIFTACSDSETSPQEPKIPEISGVTDQKLGDIVAEDSGAVSWHDHFSAILKDAQQGNGEDDSLKTALAMHRLALADSILAVYIDSLGSNGGQHGDDGKEDYSSLMGYKYVNIRYRSVDINGNPVALSELIIFPYNSIFANPHPQNIIVACHDMITANSQKPTNFSTDEVDEYANWACSALLFSSTYSDNLVIIPDYQGYGATHGDTHPFLERKLTARQVVDGVIAGKKWFEENEKSLKKGFKTGVIGYGEGGSVAMGVHQYIEQNNLSDELNFVGSSCGGGMYDPQATLNHYVQDGKVYDLATLGLMIKSLCDTNPFMKQYKLTPSDYFTDAFLKSGIMDWLSSKAYTNDEIRKKLLAYSWNNSNGFSIMRTSRSSDYEYLPYISSNEYDKNGKKRKWEIYNGDSERYPAYCEINSVLKPELVEFLKNGGSVKSENAVAFFTLKRVLSKYDIDKVWQPQHPIFLIHSPKDEVAPIVNYQNASQAIPSNNFKGLVYGGKLPDLYHARAKKYLFFNWTGERRLKGLIEGMDYSDTPHDDIIENSGLYGD